MAFDNETRARVAREWMRSPVKQSDFCAVHGISTRVLREWVRRFGVGDRPEARAVAIIDNAIERLRALREALVAEGELRDGGADEPEGETTVELVARHAEAARPAHDGASDVAPGPEQVMPIRMPVPGFSWF